MVYEMIDLKGILFLVLLKIISITSTNIDCSGNAFYCVNSTHFMICVDLGGAGVSITIDDFIIPCPQGTVCEQTNRFECEYPKTTTTAYPLGVIGVTIPKVTEIGRYGFKTTGYVTESPGTYNPESTSTVTEGVTTLSNVEILESVKSETDTIVESATEITTVNSNTPDTNNDVNEITANVKIRTSTHESMSSPDYQAFHVETVLDKPEHQIVVKEILNGSVNTNKINNNTNIIYQIISNKRDIALSYGMFTNESNLNEQVVPESVNTLIVNKQQNDYGNENNILQNITKKQPQELSGISHDKIVTDTEITAHDPTTTLSDTFITLNSNGTPNATIYDHNAVFTTDSTIIPSKTTRIITVTEYSIDNNARRGIRNSTETELANDFTTSQTLAEAYFTENNQSFDQVNTMPTEATIINITFNKTQTSVSVNQTNRNLNYSNTTVIPLDITTTTFTPENHDPNVPLISYEDNTETLLANEFITTETTLIENVNQISKKASETTYIPDIVQQISSNKVIDIYENVKNVTTSDSWSSSVNVTTTDQVSTTSTTERSPRILSSSQNYDQSLSSTTPSTEMNTSSIPQRNKVEVMTTEISYTEFVSSTNQMNTLPTKDVHVDNSYKEIGQIIKEDKITAGITHDMIVNFDETTTEQIPIITTTERIPLDSSNIQNVTSYDVYLTTAAITETINDSVTDYQRSIHDEFITTMSTYTGINLFTEQETAVPTVVSNIQDVYIDTNPSNDLVNPIILNNIHNETINITMDQGLLTTSTEISFQQQNYNTNFISTAKSPPSLETSNVKLITEHQGSIETKTTETNKIETTTELYFTESILFNDHVKQLSTEPTNIQEVSINIPIIEQNNKSKLNNEFIQDKKINITLQFTNDSLLNETSTKEQDAPNALSVEPSSIIHTDNGPKISISSTPFKKPDPSPITDYSDMNFKDKLLVTTPKGIITDTILLTVETNIPPIEEIYYKRVNDTTIPVNQTNLDNRYDQISTDTSALITEALVNESGTTESLTSTTFLEYNNSSYYIQQNITDRDQIVNMTTIPRQPIVMPVNYIERTNAQSKLKQDATESNATLWAEKESITNETSITVLPTIGIDKLIEQNANKTGNTIDKNQNLSTISNANIPPTNSTNTMVLKTEYNEKLPKVITTTTENIFTESTTIIDNMYIETQLDKNTIAVPANLQKIQNPQDRFINKKTKDVASIIQNETPIIEGKPLPNDLIGLSFTRIDNNKELQTEKPIAVIAFTTQQTLQSDDNSALSNIEKGSKFITPSPIESITDKTNEASKFNTDSNVGLVHNHTPTLTMTVVEILNTSAQFETSTNKLTVDHLEEIVKTTTVNELDTDNIIGSTTPTTQTANPLENILIESGTDQTLVSTIPYSSTAINLPTSIFSSMESNRSNIFAKKNSSLGINAKDTILNVNNSGMNIMSNVNTPEIIVGNSSDITSTTENNTNFQILSGNIVKELPIEQKYATVYTDDERSSSVSVGFRSKVRNSTLEAVTQTAPTFSKYTIKSTATKDEQVSSVLGSNKQNYTIVKNITNNNEIQNLKVVFVNEEPTNSFLNEGNASWVSMHTNTKDTNDHNITNNVFIGRDNETLVTDLTRSTAETSTPTLEGGIQNNVIYSESSLTTQHLKMLPLRGLETKSTESNQTINISSSNSLLNTSADASFTATSEPTEYEEITKHVDIKENVLINSTHGAKRDDIELQSNKIQETENINNSSQANDKVTSSEPLRNQGDIKEQVRPVNDQNASEVQNNKLPNNTFNPIKPKVNMTTNVTVNGNISNNNIVNGFHFSCLNRSRGKYADNKDCRQFYICIGRPQPLAGTCPLDTVFSEINKQCTRNLSHCVRNNQFRCLLEGRFSDFLSDNVYYICIKNSFNNFIRYKLQCQSGFHLNKDAVKCEHNVDVSSLSASSVSENSQKSNDDSESKQKQEASSFECEKEGKFPYPDDCRRYYVCSQNSKAEYRRKIKQCSSDEVFHSEKKKCIEPESNVC